jgi:hypothetical protein
MMTVLQHQGAVVIKDDLTPYRGRWVAIRDGHVVADALDSVELRDRKDVHEDDYLMLVPSQYAKTLVL